MSDGRAGSDFSYCPLDPDGQLKSQTRDKQQNPIPNGGFNFHLIAPLSIVSDNTLSTARQFVEFNPLD